MPVPFYGLPPLRALAVFESAARNGNLRDAAREFNVTPGAISQHIRQLEQHMHTSLFMREGRGLALTDAGKELCLALENAFTDLGAVIRRIQSRSQSRGRVVLVAASRAVGAYVLGPLLAEFMVEHPQIDVQPVLSDNVTVPGGREADLRISCVSAPPESEHSLLFQDRVAAVCSPAQSIGLPARFDLSDLARSRLIHVQSAQDRSLGWKEWFAAMGYHGEIARGVVVDNYMSAVQMSEAGVGISLGWKNLLRGPFQQQRLVQIGAWEMQAPSAFYLEHLADHKMSGEARLLRDFLRARISA